MEGRHLTLNGISRERRASNVRTLNAEIPDSSEDFVVPAFPMSVALLCCVFNFMVPGLGKFSVIMFKKTGFDHWDSNT